MLPADKQLVENNLPSISCQDRMPENSEIRSTKDVADLS